MMPLGLTGSHKADGAGATLANSNGVNASSQNNNDKEEFAKALNDGPAANQKGNKTKETSNGQTQPFQFGGVNKSLIEGDSVVIEGAAGDGLEIDTGNLEVFKTSASQNTKQIAFVTIDGSLAQKLAPVNMTNSNSDTKSILKIDVDGAGKAGSGIVEKLSKDGQVIKGAQNEPQSSTKNVDTVEMVKPGEAKLTEKVSGKIVPKEFMQSERKENISLQNKVANSVGSELKKSSLEKPVFERVDFKTVVNRGENSISNNEKEVKLTEILVKTAGDKINKEGAAERSADRFSNSNGSNLQSAAAQVKIKSLNNTSKSTVSIMPESKVENLANALQQLATTSAAKTTGQVETVSAPRLVLPESQSIVPQKTIEIQLLPKTLGLIQVKIEINDGKMTLMIETQSAKAEAAIKLESVQIMDTIKAAGLSVEEVSVRRNAELSQQDQAINDFSSDANAQEKFANGDFDEHFEGQNGDNNQSDMDDLKTGENNNGGQSDTRSGIYL